MKSKSMTFLFVVFIVVSTRKNSFEEEIDTFKFTLNTAEVNFQEEHHDEVVFKKESKFCTKTNDEEKADSEESLHINFSEMTKVTDAPQHPVNDSNEDINLESFIKSMSKQKYKEKRMKARSEEHSDKESSASSEEEEEEEEETEEQQAVMNEDGENCMYRQISCDIILFIYII